jgi:hypothetical protein
MLNRELRFPFCRFAFFILLGAIFAGCGAVTQSKNGNLQLELQAPDDPNFWMGVSQKKLRITDENGHTQDLSWQPGQGLNVDVRAGDKVEFLGLDNQGKLLVEGEATASEEKSLTIPLHQVL